MDGSSVEGIGFRQIGVGASQPTRSKTQKSESMTVTATPRPTSQGPVRPGRSSSAP